MFSDTLEALKHLLWPTRCAACEVLLVEPDKLVCDKCKSSVAQAPDIPLPEFIDRVCPLFIYDGAVSNMIAKWKYHEDFSAQNAILSFLPTQIQRLKAMIHEDSWMIPVPPHPRRLQERGFDPVWTFATRLVHVLKEAEISVTFCDDALIRTRHTPHQASLSHDERLKNLKDAFKVVKPIQTQHVILIDDVMTTGATGSVCAQILKESGVSWVGMIALAHPVDKVKSENA